MVQRFSVCQTETISMVTRDGVRLDADIYRPNAEGPCPVLLMRQPYGRQIASTVVYAHPTWYAAHGFITVIQDVRGRGTSEGEFVLFEHEVEDGFDTVEWAARLPQSNGRVGMYGFSYQGMTQLFAAQSRPPSLCAIAPAMVGYHPHEDWAYENGALLLQAGVGWAIQLAAETARLRRDEAAFQALYRASRQLPIYDDIPACPQVLQQYAPESFFHTWLDHPDYDEYWECITPKLDEVDLPMLHIGGWWDPYLRGDIRLYHEMVGRSLHPHPIWIGPWGHIPWGRKVGSRDFGPAANSPVDRLQIDWFTRHLKAAAASRSDQPAVNMFDMGANRWQALQQWPQSSRVQWQLVSSGLASIDPSDGQLRLVGGTQQWLADESSPPTAPAVDMLVHDPWRPVPSLGGHAAIPPGPFERSAIDCRSDVLTYTSAPLVKPMAIAGRVEISICCQSDRPTFDLSIVLSDGLPEGSVYPITQGYGRFQQRPNQWTTCHLALQPTCYSLAAGHTLRVSVSAACYPAYALNPGVDSTYPRNRVMDAQTTTVSIRCGRSEETSLSFFLMEESGCIP